MLLAAILRADSRGQHLLASSAKRGSAAGCDALPLCPRSCTPSGYRISSVHHGNAEKEPHQCSVNTASGGRGRGAPLPCSTHRSLMSLLLPPAWVLHLLERPAAYPLPRNDRGCMSFGALALSRSLSPPHTHCPLPLPLGGCPKPHTLTLYLSRSLKPRRWCSFLKQMGQRSKGRRSTSSRLSAPCRRQRSQRQLPRPRRWQSSWQAT